MGSTVQIGAVKIEAFYEAKLSCSGESSDYYQPFTLSGQASWTIVSALRELILNRDAVSYLGSYRGVLEFVQTDHPELNRFTGMCLLQGFSWDVGDSETIPDSGVPVPFTIKGVLLGGAQLVLATSAQARPNTNGIVANFLVADPVGADASQGTTFSYPPGGSFFTREFLSDTGVSKQLALYTGTLDQLLTLGVPDWDEHFDYGAAVRAFDRSRDQVPVGRNHRFARSTDMQVMNGMIGFWVGSEGDIPYLNVQSYVGGVVCEEGTIALTANSAQTMLRARLVRITKEEAAVVLSVKGLGEISVVLRRGARRIDIHHGEELPPFLSTTRTVRWLGGPPPVEFTGVTSNTGRFGSGIRGTLMRWRWPNVVAKEWGASGWWLPGSTSIVQADSGLFGLLDSAGLVGGLTYTAATKKLNFALGASVVSSQVLTFAANTPIFWHIGFTLAEGMTLHVGVQGGAIAGATATGAGPNTADQKYSHMSIGALGAGLVGATSFASTASGLILRDSAANGTQDNLMVFDGPLSLAESTALFASVAALADLPQPEGRLVWYGPYDTTPVPLGSAVASGRRFQATAENGSIRSPASWGFTKVLAALGAVTAQSPFGLTATASKLDASAILATTGTKDDMADHHSQFVGATSQEPMVR